jgi:hypothetical protein
MMMILGTLLFVNDDGILLVNSLGLDITSLKIISKSKNSVKLQNVITDVEILLR